MRTKKMPALSKLMSRNAKRETQSVQQQMAMVRILNAMYGGKVVKAKDNGR